MHIVIAGCGRVGSQLAEQLAFEGHNVAVIDKNASSFSRLGGTFNGITVTGQAFDEKVLEEAGIRKAGAFAAVTNYDNTNLMAAQIALSVFRVPAVITRLYDPDRRHTYKELGIDYVCGTALVAERMKEKLLAGYMVTLHERLDLGLQVVEFFLNQKAEGRKVADLFDSERARLLTVFRGNESLGWNDDTFLSAGDRVVVTLRREGLGLVLEFVDRESIP